jgi:phospholipid/cholesterol/gamma-HCH transport system ATP-binding protein
MIEVKNVSKSFAGKQVLDDVSAKFYPGKCNFVIGASGSGKSVLMKSMVGLIDVDKGNINYSGIDFLHISYEEKQELRKQIGMLFQGSALFDSLTVEENVAFPLQMLARLKPSEVKDRVNFCLSRVDLNNVNHLYPSSLSGGMKKRVGIARAIALNPQYLFCDEPNSGLDPITSRKIDYLIQEITQEYNITTIINTHDMKSLFEMGDNIIFIYRGKKYWEGHKSEIRQTDKKELLEFLKASEF